MNTFNISAIIEYTYRHSNGDVNVVSQCEAALEELSELVSAVQKKNTVESSSEAKKIMTGEEFLSEIDRAIEENEHKSSKQSTRTGGLIKPRCICRDFINWNPDPVPNPDCPIHGAGMDGAKFTQGK